VVRILAVALIVATIAAAAYAAAPALAECGAPWPVPAGDDDCDGFSTAREVNNVGTLEWTGCDSTSTANDNDPESWPTDHNNDQRTDLGDIATYGGPIYNSAAPGPPYHPRWDLNADSWVDLGDISIFSPFYNRSCIWNFAPAASKSLYIRNPSPSLMYQQGCEQGNSSPDNTFVILAFGRPRYSEESELGTQLPKGDYGFLPITGLGSEPTIEVAALNYILGFYDCSADTPGKYVKVAIGTSNCIHNPDPNGCQPDDPAPEDFMYQHGLKFGTMVEHINTTLVSNGMAARTVAWGAIDIEPDWATFVESEPWVLGFAAAPNNNAYVNFGSADGCPSAPGGGTCNNDWTQHNIWSVSRSSLLGWPFPEIYNELGTHARQWQQIALAVQPAYFHAIGSLTTWQACEPEPGDPQPPDCSGIRNQPAVGWQQLQATMNSDPESADPVHWSSDIANSDFCEGGVPLC
jgi:hypothetical protein